MGGTRVKFQEEAVRWANETFPSHLVGDINERNERFLEEALELVQAADMTSEAAHALVDHVFSRPKGEVAQEIGGVGITLAVLGHAHAYDVATCVYSELTRVWSRQQEIRARQREKPRFTSSAESGQ